MEKINLISVIMPLYNAEKYVAEAIQSVISQSYTHWELIIVNDGSTDNSLEVAKKYESDKIKVVTQVNKGAGAARNYGYSISKGEFIKFFDADDILSANMLKEQVGILIGNDNCIATSQWGRFYNNDLTTFKLSPEDCWQDMQPIPWIQSSWKKAQPMTQPGMILIPRKIIEIAGNWKEHLSKGPIDDFEFFTRIILASDGVRFAENTTLYYRSGLIGALSGRKSRIAVESAIASADLSIGYFLKLSNDKASKRLCANLLMTLVYNYSMAYPDLLKPVELKIKVLGGSNLKIKKGKIFNFAIKILGWKIISNMIKI